VVFRLLLAALFFLGGCQTAFQLADAKSPMGDGIDQIVPFNFGQNGVVFFGFSAPVGYRLYLKNKETREFWYLTPNLESKLVFEEQGKRWELRYFDLEPGDYEFIGFAAGPVKEYKANLWRANFRLDSQELRYLGRIELGNEVLVYQNLETDQQFLFNRKPKLSEGRVKSGLEILKPDPAP